MISVLIFTQADGKELLSVTSQADRIFYPNTFEALSTNHYTLDPFKQIKGEAYSPKKRFVSGQQVELESIRKKW